MLERRARDAREDRTMGQASNIGRLALLAGLGYWGWKRIGKAATREVTQEAVDVAKVVAKPSASPANALTGKVIQGTDLSGVLSSD